MRASKDERPGAGPSPFEAAARGHLRVTEVRDGRTPMRLGLFMMPVHPPARSFADTLAEESETKSLYADTLGFDEMYGSANISPRRPSPSPRR